MKRLLDCLSNIFLKINKLNWETKLIPFLLTLLFPFFLWHWSDAIKEYEAKKSLLLALKTELHIIEPWAKESYTPDPISEYQENNQHFEWYDPNLHLFSFNRSTITSLLSNPAFLNLNTNLTTSLIILDQKARELYERQDNLRQYIFAYPMLLEEANKWIDENTERLKDIYQKPNHELYVQIFSVDMDQRLRNYLNTIYRENYEIYVNCIGSSIDPKKDGEKVIFGLHLAWLSCHSSLVKAEKSLKSPSLISHFLILEILAMFFVVPSLWSFFYKHSTTNKSGLIVDEEKNRVQGGAKVNTFTDMESWGRHYDTLLWTVTAIMGATLAILSISCIEKFRIGVSICGYSLTVIAFYFAASFAELRRLCRERYDKKSIWFELRPARKLKGQWIVYCTIFTIIELFWILLIFKHITTGLSLCDLLNNPGSHLASVFTLISCIVLFLSGSILTMWFYFSNNHSYTQTPDGT